MALTCGLYVAATPIGNLKDITLRALEALKACDLILCEDTRVSGKLLKAYDISTPLKIYHEHNAARTRPQILTRLEGGATICLISDAGTPLISDPGFKLVKEAREKDINVYALPGASALTTAISISGLPSDRFLFAGFPPPKTNARKSFFAEFSSLAASLVFFETGPRLADSLSDMAFVYGNRDVCVMRELTKHYEEARQGSLNELAEEYTAKGPPKGEIVIVVGRGEIIVPDKEEIDARLTEALKTLSVKDASGKIAAETGLAKKILYARALELKGAK